MIRKIAFLCSIMVIGFAVGYGGYNVTFARHHHHGPIPGVDIPYNPSAYYSPTALDYADSPSTFALRDLASNGGNVYDYTRHIKSILSATNALDWLRAAIEKTGIDILNSTPIASEDLEKNRDDIFAMHNVAVNYNQGSYVSNLVQGKLFRSPSRYDEDTNNYDSQRQQQALEDVYVDMARSAQAVVNSSAAQQETYARIMQDAANATGDMQIQQAQAEAEAFQEAQTAQKNALLSNLSALKALDSKVEQDETVEYLRTVQAAQLHVQDPYHRSPLEQKQYESTHPSEPKGFADFK